MLIWSCRASVRSRFMGWTPARCWDALGRIEPAYQAAVALFYLEDHSYQEIAEILGVPLGTVKSRISRGVGQLQSRLLETSRPVRS
jgi:DNA-directed RNA polymerase specialized sigma24 family protein